MADKTMARRTFMKTSVAGVGTALAAGGFAEAEDPKTRFVRLGAPVQAKSDDPEELARRHRELGYRAAYCPQAAVTDTARIRAISDAFAKNDVVIAEVGRWVNLLESDPGKRQANLKTVIDGLALAEAVGARCCVDIVGSFNPDSWFGPHPDNLSPRFFDAAVENARKIIDAVKPKRTAFCYEMMAWSIPDDVDSCVKLIRAVDRPAFAAHLDPCNLINSPGKFYRNTDLLNECYDKLAPWIVSAHAKDLRWEIEMSIHFREVIPGTGSLDYATFLKRHAQLPQQPPLMLEHLSSPQEYDQAREFVFSKGREQGISFGSP
jgi:sugar phosphate isomerase/epimerase